MKTISNRNGNRPGVPQAHIQPITGRERKVRIFGFVVGFLFLLLLLLSPFLSAQDRSSYVVNTGYQWNALSSSEKQAYLDGFFTALFTILLRMDQHPTTITSLEDVRDHCSLDFYSKDELLRIVDTFYKESENRRYTIWSIILLAYGQRWWSDLKSKSGSGGREICPLGVSPPLLQRDLVPVPLYLSEEVSK